MFEAAYPAVALRQHELRPCRQRDGCLDRRRVRLHQHPVGPDARGQRRRDDRSPAPRCAKLSWAPPSAPSATTGPRSATASSTTWPSPQVGPGFGNGADGHDDFGRMRKTGDPADTLPVPHRAAPQRGADRPLRARRRHHRPARLGGSLQPVRPEAAQLRVTTQLEPLLRTTLQPTADDILATRDYRLKKLVLTPEAVDEITEFLKALTDPGARNLRPVVPLAVPSGLPVDDLP